MKKKYMFMIFIILTFSLIKCKNNEIKIKYKKNQSNYYSVLYKKNHNKKINFTNKVIKIGLNLPLTGPYADQGQDELRAFELIKDEINQNGGILGKKIKYVIKDSKSKPGVSRKNAIELIDKYRVKMITGGVSSSVAIAVSEICQKKKTLFIATVTHSDATTGKKAHRHMFRKCTSATMDARALASVLNKYYGTGRTYCYITADYTWGWSTEGAIRKILDQTGAYTLKVERTKLGTRDFHPVLKKMSAFKADVLVLVLFGNDLVHAIKQLTELKLKSSFKLIVVPYIELNMALKAGPEAVQGIIASVPWYWQLDKRYKNAKIFVDRFKEKYKRMPSNCAESAYMGIIEYVRAVQRIKSFNPSLVIKALEGHQFTGLKDKEVWRSWDHQCVQTVYLLKGKYVHEMVNQYDLFDIVYEVKGQEIIRSRKENPIILEPLNTIAATRH